ncbi:NADH-quinone oxidoreductase subunit L [Chelatococcus composti]|uniref:NADH-quinone oxidoreductase subunit L n=1 Tax=Chelatococcus composti TaxID=1743235 RepID=A0A841K2P8_9HYPH|nr:NADH-quinone oxidoreductase subunit L [Chelatococcus composti]MBB6167018.1 NADH-quinone oxidoreductase subunit L [Chelatococcus composti]MBS7737082.1 NADH-quinone oxidoreductase subunit L [Chelatococcus composti]GGG24117.1 NADH:ubiquinone oxidoreductase subunit L [Chelatococcus composti]
MYHAIVFLPLAGFLIAGLAGRFIGARASEVITTSGLFVSCALSWIAFFDVAFGDGATRVTVANWIISGDLAVDWAFRIDTLTAVMLIVVTTVSSLVHLYSIGYMHEDPSRPRFFAYLSLFTFAMLMLVTADNLVQMFFGWEGVGLASYLLIGFWYEKPSANAAAIKAFVVNRVGDFGFLLGIFLLFVLFGAVTFDGIFPRVAEFNEATFRFLGHEWHALTLACLLLFMGAMGKSAQFLLHTWLPDAMEGPTPVSALIHAATMVTAGVFMVARMSPVFEYAPTALSVVTVIGGITAFFAATVGLVQNDIKRVIAYSTCSQLGYMFVALGVGAYGAGVFHLFTHAFFKALLFLGAGSVIHAMHHEQDMRHMGGLRKHIPFTAAMMTIGTLALTGFPFTAGYFSKDAIIEAAYASHTPGANFAFIATVIAALFTSFYSWRLYFLTFEGKPRWAGHGHGHDDHGHGHGDHTPHESPLVMLIPLAVLAIGVVVAGFAFKEAFIGHDYDNFWKGALFTGANNHILHEMHEVPGWVVASPFVMMVLGFLIALWFYVLNPRMPAALAAQQPLLYRFLLNKWYFDELYDFLFVRPAMWLGRVFWKKGDGWLIDGFGPDGVSARVVDVTNRVVRLQTGYVFHYAFAMLVGVAALVTWYLIGGTH